MVGHMYFSHASNSYSVHCFVPNQEYDPWLEWLYMTPDEYCTDILPGSISPARKQIFD
jgi:hypothetical protein